MRFSCNEGQNTEPDVILILIKEGRVALKQGLQSILLNTINPVFIFGANKGCRERRRARPLWFRRLVSTEVNCHDQTASWTWEAAEQPLPILAEVQPSHHRRPSDVTDEGRGGGRLLCSNFVSHIYQFVWWHLIVSYVDQLCC